MPPPPPKLSAGAVFLLLVVLATASVSASAVLIVVVALLTAVIALVFRRVFVASSQPHFRNLVNNLKGAGRTRYRQHVGDGAAWRGLTQCSQAVAMPHYFDI